MKTRTKSALALALLGGGLAISGSAFAVAGQSRASIDSISSAADVLKVDNGQANGHVPSAAPSAIAPYCTNTFTSGVEPITLLQINEINNPSSAATTSAAHEDFTAIAGTLRPGATYAVTMKANTDGASFSHGNAIYADWNQDGDFEDAGEGYWIGIITGSTGLDATSVTAYITVPADATPGDTRLRAMTRFGTTGLAALLPCNTAGYGQSEDYTITIDPAAVVPPLPLTMAMAFAPEVGTVPVTSTLTFTFGNINPNPAVLTADFLNTLPAGMEVATPSAATTTCSGTLTAVDGGNTFTLGNGGAIPVGGCTLSVDITATVGGNYVYSVPAGALQTDMGNGPAASASFTAIGGADSQSYATGFEAPFTVAALNGQQGWGARTWTVSDTVPAHGSQHLRATSLASPTTSTRALAISPTVAIGTAPYAAVTANLRLSRTTNGATWQFNPQDPAAGLVTTILQFERSVERKIQAIEFQGDGSGVLVDTGAAWPIDEYFKIRTIVNRETGALKHCMNDVQIYEDLTGAAAAGLNIANVAISQAVASGQTANNTMLVDDLLIEYVNSFNCVEPLTVTPSVGVGSGTISPDTPQLVNPGSSTTFTLVPAPDFAVDNVGGTCGGTLVGDTFETNPVSENCTVIANFKAASLVVSKSFEPTTISEAEQSIAVITLTNQKSVNATLTAAFMDVLPTGLEVVSATTNCGMILGSNEPQPTILATQFGLPAGIVLPAESTCEIRATIQPAGGAGVYVNQIAAGGLQTDQGNNSVAAEATLTVTGFPTIEVNPTSLSSTLVTNTTGTSALDIKNVGTGDLVWDITEAAGANLNPPSFRNVTSIGLAAGSVSLQKGAGLGLAGRGAPVVLAATDISQMADNSPGDEGVACGSQTNGTTADNSWWRRFYFNEHPAVGGAATVTSVTISTGTFDIPGGLPTTINLYTIPHGTPVDTIPTSALTLIGTTSTTVSGSLVSVTIPVTGTISDTVATDLVVEWHTAGTDSGSFFPGANGTPETHPTFISSETCSISAPTPVDNVGSGFPDFHLTMVVSLESGGDCSSPSDLPWLSVSDPTGSTGAGSTDSVSVAFSANGMAPGTYSGQLCIASNDAVNPLVSVPVEMVVEASGLTFDVTPSVTGGGGTISPDTVQTVDENDSVSFTLTPEFGFGVGSVGGTCPGARSGDTYVAGPIAANCTVEVEFEPLPFPQPYCNVNFTQSVEPISRVVFGGFDNASSPAVGGSPALENFTAVVGNVSQGGVYDIAVEGNTDGNYTSKIRVFFDWNRNGSFDDAGEGFNLSDLISSTGADGKQSTGQISVPANAWLGEVRMRVVKNFNSVPGSCHSGSYGQAEDYTIAVDNQPLPAPAIDLDKFSLSMTAMSGTTGTDTLEVSNVGEVGSRLEFQIRRALAARLAEADALIEARNQARANDIARGGDAEPAQYGAHESLRGYSDGALPAVRNVVFANDPLCDVGTQGLVVHDGNGVPDNGYGWNAAAGTDAKIVDKFTPSMYPASYSTVCVSLVSNAGVTSAPVTVVVFDDNGPGGAPGTELGRVSATANNIASGLVQSFQAIDVSAMALEITEGSVYIGLEWNAAVVTGLYFAADETSATDAGGYSYSSGEWTPTIEGFENYKAMFVRAIETASGPPGVGCENPSNVPWLSVSPASGTVLEGESQTVTVTANATGMAPGTYDALICVSSNDPDFPRIDLPVTLQVTARPPAIFDDGFEGDDPMCWPTQLFEDPSFEATDDSYTNPYWVGFDSLFDTPFCDSTCDSSGNVTAHTGTWFVWVGGAYEPTEASVTQDVVLTAGQPRWINYWLRNQMQGDPTATLEIRIDGNTIHSVPASAGDPTAFTAMNFEVPASYLDGNTHTIGFFWQADSPAGELSGAMLDDVTLDCSANPAGARPANVRFEQAIKRNR